MVLLFLWSRWLTCFITKLPFWETIYKVNYLFLPLSRIPCRSRVIYPYRTIYLFYEIIRHQVDCPVFVSKIYFTLSLFVLMSYTNIGIQFKQTNPIEFYCSSLFYTILNIIWYFRLSNFILKEKRKCVCHFSVFTHPQNNGKKSKTHLKQTKIQY